MVALADRFEAQASGIVEAVSAEDIGKLPDQSIAESLSRLPGVTEAHVAAHADVLVAWVAGTADEQAVRAVLRAELPPAMSPRVVLLPDMPRNERGKLDTASLGMRDKIALRAQVAALKARPKRTPEEQAMLDNGGNFDFTHRKSLRPLLRWVREES